MVMQDQFLFDFKIFYIKSNVQVCKHTTNILFRIVSRMVLHCILNFVEYPIIISIARHGQKDENKRIPRSTVQSKRGMWCSNLGAEVKTCPSTEENMSVNVMLDWFFKILSSQRRHPT